MSQAIDALSTPEARVSSAEHPDSPDAALLASREGAELGAEGDDAAPAEARGVDEILTLPARTLAALAAKMEAALADAAHDPGAARLRQVVEEGLPVIQAALAGAATWKRFLPLARAMARMVEVTLPRDVVMPDEEPTSETLAAAAPAPPAPADGDSRRLCGPIELDILHRALVGWVATLAALQLSMEDSEVPPAAFDAIVASIVNWRDKVGRALPPEERTSIS